MVAMTSRTVALLVLDQGVDDVADLS